MRAIAALLFCLAVARAQDRDLALLREQGLRPDAESLGAYLHALHPDEKTRRLAAALVARLGEKTSFRRDEAALRLAALRTAAVSELKRVADSDDPEVRRLARQLLQRTLRSVRKDVLVAVLRTVKQKRMPGLVHDLLGVAPLAVDLYVLSDVEGALKASARPGDLPRLRTGLLAEDLDARATAVLGLGAVLAADALGELYPLLKSELERVRLAAAWALADRGDRTGLGTFGALLDARDARVRSRAARALRHISGKTFGYSPRADAPQRAGPVAAWREWLAAHRETVSWERPVAPGPTLHGRTLISIYRKNHVIEVDRQGRTLWETFAVRNPWTVQGLPNGNRLVVEYRTKTLIEFDAQGKEVWRREGLPGFVSSVQRLANGNTLIAMAQPNLVAEMRPDGSYAWQLDIGGHPTDAKLLDNGRILVALRQRKQVVEIDRSGKVLWKLEGLRSPWSAQRLPSGNTLVCDIGQRQVQEYDRDGRVVWSCSANTSYSAQRLPNGKTLLADSTGVRELDRDGSVHWLYKSQNQFVRASQY
ncbi:MAG: outer membrane protein assembly factor BamB family protein [Planctomycetota bacterium]